MRKMLFIYAAVLLSSIGLHAGNTITYTASARLSGYDGSLIVGATTFGPAIISHEFFYGVGTITCSGEITKIGNGAFQRCSNLSSVTIPNSVTTIGSDAFYESGLKSIEIPSSVTALGEYVFMDCSRLSSVTIPNSIEILPTSTFFGCTSLKSIEIPSSVTTIGISAFRESGLTSITIPASVKEINERAFMGCTGLSSVKVNWTDAQSIVSLSIDVFEEIANGAGPQGATLYVPEGTANLYKQANVWKEFGSITIHKNTMTYTASEKLPGYDGSLDVGKTTFGPAITSHTFSNGTGTITCSGEITTIGEGAFRGCTGLTSITILTSVTTIGKQAFYECKSMTSVTIPNSVTTIGKQAFYICSGLTSITIPQSVTTIEEQAFEGSSTGLTSIVVAGSNPKYDSRDNCNAIIEKATNTLILGCKHTKIPNNIITIGRSAFDGCYDLKDLTIPNSVTTIGRSAFWECKSLTSITLPNSVTTIGINAFCGAGLTSITIPASVKEINDNAFWDCTDLTDLQFAERTDAIKIGAYAFENTALKVVVIPDWTTEISEGLFYKNSQLETINLPASVIKINSRSFENCPNLKYIFSMSETPPALAEGAFKGHDKDDNVIVYVPSQDAKNAYKSSSWSKYFTNFITDIEYRITSSSTVEVISAVPFEGEVTIPSATVLSGNYYQVTGIADSAFYEEDSLVSILLPPTIQYIGANAFNGCTQLRQTNSRFLGGLQTIGDRAFYGCSALDSIVIPEGVQTIGKSAFMGCSKLTSISLPAGLKNIPDECFKQCPLGQEIIVPEGVETIGESAFEGTNEAKLNAESLTLPSTLKEINFAAFFFHDGLKGVTCLATTPPTLKDQVFAEYKYQKYKDEHITVYVPNRDVIAAYRDNKNQWGSDLYKFKFTDLMSEENKQYLYTVAGDNEEAQAIASVYCDSIDNYANNSEDVQQYTNTALGKIDKITLAAYKQNLIDSLANYAKSKGENIQAQQIAEQYAPQIRNAYFRQDAEQLFTEAMKKITDIFELIDLKKDYKEQLVKLADGDNDLLKVAADYGALIQLAETKDEAYDLYIRAQMRIEANRQIKNDWTGQPSQKAPLKCSTTRGYIDNH